MTTDDQELSPSRMTARTGGYISSMPGPRPRISEDDIPESPRHRAPTAHSTLIDANVVPQSVQRHGTVSRETAEQVRRLPDLMDRIRDMGLTGEYVAFRERYLGWRQGRTVGASGELGSQRVHSRGFGFWYPTVTVWQWRRTLSYWIAVTFFGGSFFFMVSSFLWCYPERLGKLKHTVTTWGYMAGKVNFLICTYLMCLETINLSNADHDKPTQLGSLSDSSDEETESSVEHESHTRVGMGKDEKWLWWPFHVRTAIAKLEVLGAGPWPYFASAIYLVGVLTFAIGLIPDFLPHGTLDEEVSKWVLNLAFLFGSLFFFLGGFAECIENQVFTTCSLNQGWVGAALNLLGGAGFLVGAIMAFFPGGSFYSMFTYGIGSGIYLLGAGVMIIMWKDEQFGLTFLAVLNKLGGPTAKPVLNNGHGDDVEEDHALSFMTAVFVMIYIITGSLSVYDFMISINDLWSSPDPSRIVERSFNAFLPCIFAYVMLALTSGVYKTPEVAPFHQLYIGCRYLAIAMCINSAARFIQALQAEWGHVVDPIAMDLA